MTRIHYLAACGGLSAIGRTAFHTAIAEVRTPELLGPAKAFADGISRIAGLLWLPPFIAAVSVDWNASVEQALRELAEVSETTIRIESPEKEEEAAKRAWQLMHERQAERSANDPEWKKRILFGALKCEEFVRRADAGIANSLDTMLKSSIILAWSFFEAWAGDMWEAAVNAHPAGLAELKGIRNRIGDRHRDRSSAPQRSVSRSDKTNNKEESKLISLSSINQHTKGTYDLSTKMGSVLRERYEFANLNEMRFAYREAFYKHYEKIDKALGDTSIDTLNVIRNVIVHNSGIADDQYISRSVGLPSLPQVSVGIPVTINGLVSVGLIIPVIERSADLLRAVDRWLVIH